MHETSWLAQDHDVFVSRLKALGHIAEIAHFRFDTGSAKILLTCVDNVERCSPLNPSEVAGSSQATSRAHNEAPTWELSDEPSQLRRWLSDRNPPWLLVPGWVSSLPNWAEIVSVLAQKNPVMVAFTREKVGTVLHPGAGQSVREVVADIAAVIDSLPTAPGAVWGVSTGAGVLAELIADKTLAAQTLTVFGLPHQRIPVPKAVTYLPRLPTAGKTAIRAVSKKITGRDSDDYRTTDLLRALQQLGVEHVATSASHWRDWQPRWQSMAQSLVIGVNGDRMHPLRDARAVSVAVGGHLLEYATYCDGHSVTAGQDVVSYWHYGNSSDG